MSEVIAKAKMAKEASFALGVLSTEQKNQALLQMADHLITRQAEIIEANAEDLERGRQTGLSVSLLDRLALNESRIEAMAEGLRQIVELPDPVGETLQTMTRPNGLRIRHLRVPIGLIGIIYEARPNVTVDAAGLCLKTGNAVVLRGGSAALSSNRKIIDILHDALDASAIPKDALQIVEDASRSSVDEMLKLNGIIDTIIPRGGASLIQNVVQNATVPVIETGAGICHTYLDAEAEPAMASDIAFNAKVQRPSVCNAMETLLVHESFAAAHLPDIAQRMKEANVELRGDKRACTLVPGMKEAAEQDWSTEYNDYVLNVKIVSSLDEALMHIRRYGTMHSECIVTENELHARRFLAEVDAAAVYHNASTRFTDGFEFGYGAEIGISTQKLHARGPMGLPALTSSKYLIEGSGQIRQ
ncbi:glutamate-5-semialdehyde dehydrogenase [Xylanibacillus composti]|uniref:Gamma-glutamyl phosphate reductase n=1 Tax=Xylanibacillus composti TaxID=1572762 RepID=A0A8J4M0L6_9BACL|nr:glutamate-5-semialdehyde dehydrogenase [Xylanibacillus composti]MDT9725515.1 glutamate-5-semialdehyde dehydrogenase [Xylanibacillus composti]GIQ67609.1 gamma-glutamyl phosphate reductase [Xylanibacillus composti]